jgi:hypothetical protein
MNVGIRSSWIVMALAVILGPLVSGCHDGSSSWTSTAQPSDAPASPQASNRSVTLAWEAPTENSDGTPLLNLSGYRIYYGNVPSALTHVIDVTNASLTRYAVEGLVAGTYYFAIASYNALGIESNLSAEVATNVN